MDGVPALREEAAAIGLGVVVGWLLARYGFNLNLIHSRTGATRITVVCGLAVVCHLERRPGAARLALLTLCALMLALFAEELGSVRELLRAGTERRASRSCMRPITICTS